MAGLISGESQSPSLHVEPDALNRLRHNSAQVAKRIKKLYIQRQDYNAYMKLYEEMSRLHGFLLKPNDQFCGRAWLVFMEECGPAAMYTRFILRDGFFEEDALFVSHVFQGLKSIATASIEMEDTETQHFLLANCSALFQTVWLNRELLLKKSVAAGIGVLDHAHPVLWCLEPFQKLHTYIHGQPAGLDSYLAHVGLFGWLSFKDTLFSRHGLARFVDVEKQISDEALDAFVQEALVNGMGIETLFRSFEDALADLSTHDVLVRMRFATSKLFRHSALLPLLREREIIKHYVVRLGHFAHISGLDDDDSKGPWMEWLAGYNLYRTAWLDQLRAVISAGGNITDIKLRGEDAITCMAYGSRWIAQASFRRRIDDYVIISDYCEVLSQELHEFAHFPFMSKLSKAVPDFIAGLVRGMREVWMPTLIALRTGRSDLGEFSDSYDQLLDAWMMLGTAMGLDESWERKEMRKFCSHWRCLFNTRQPPSALLSCRGCGEARYCSKECQRGDWKVHKRLCGKRLK